MRLLFLFLLLATAPAASAQEADLDPATIEGFLSAFQDAMVTDDLMGLLDLVSLDAMADFDEIHVLGLAPEGDFYETVLLTLPEEIEADEDGDYTFVVYNESELDEDGNEIGMYVAYILRLIDGRYQIDEILMAG